MNIQEWLFGLLENKVLLSAVCGCVITQLIKLVIDLASGHFSFKKIFESGGMPSSHSALVCALATSCGIVEGSTSSIFVISVILAAIVMYDAMGVRLSAGRNTEVLNKMRRRDIEDGRNPLMDHDLKVQRGHTLPEIVIGAALGIMIAVAVCIIL